MYGVSLTAIREQMPNALAKIEVGDIVFISEKEISNALFGPFYVVNDRPPIVIKKLKGSTRIEIDVKKTLPKDIAYWVEFENRPMVYSF